MADVGAIIQGIGGIVGGLSNYWSNYETNVTNKNLQRETNQQNKELFYQQLAAAREQYERERQENRYLVDQAYQRSLPKEQVKALREAGINPAFAFDSGSFGTPSTQIGSPPSSPTPSAPTMVAPQMVAPDLSALGQGISNAANYYLSSQRQEADISYLKQKEVNETLETIGRLQKYTYENKHLEAVSNQIMQDVLFNQETWNSRKQNLDLINQVNRADIEYKQSLKNYQDILNNFEPDKQKKILKNLDAEYDNIQSSIRKNDADSALSYAHKALVDAQKEGVQIDNEVANQIVEARINVAYDEEEAAYWNARNARKEAGTEKHGVGPYTVEQRNADDAANDPNHMRVFHDRKGRKFFYDAKSNKRIYVE